MILIIVAFLLSAICAWNMAKCDEEQEAREMAWKLLALAAVTELYKQKKKLEGEADEADDRTSD